MTAPKAKTPVSTPSGQPCLTPEDLERTYVHSITFGIQGLIDLGKLDTLASLPIPIEVRNAPEEEPSKFVMKLGEIGSEVKQTAKDLPLAGWHGIKVACSATGSGFKRAFDWLGEKRVNAKTALREAAQAERVKEEPAPVKAAKAAK